MMHGNNIISNQYRIDVNRINTIQKEAAYPKDSQIVMRIMMGFEVIEINMTIFSLIFCKHV